MNFPCFSPAWMQGITTNVIIVYNMQFLYYYEFMYITIMFKVSSTIHVGICMLVSGDCSCIILMWCHNNCMSGNARTKIHDTSIIVILSYWHGERHITMVGCFQNPLVFLHGLMQWFLDAFVLLVCILQFHRHSNMHWLFTSRCVCSCLLV